MPWAMAGVAANPVSMANVSNEAVKSFDFMRFLLVVDDAARAFALPEFSAFSRLKDDSAARLLSCLCQRLESLADIYPAFTRQAK